MGTWGCYSLEKSHFQPEILPRIAHSHRQQNVCLTFRRLTNKFQIFKPFFQANTFCFSQNVNTIVMLKTEQTDIWHCPLCVDVNLCQHVCLSAC